MRELKDSERKRIRKSLEKAGLAIATVCENLSTSFTDGDDFASSEFSDLSALDKAIVELLERFSHLWSESL